MKATRISAIGAKAGLAAAAMSLLCLVGISLTGAQEPRKRPHPADPQGEEAPAPDERRRSAPGDREGTPEGMPQTRIAPGEGDRRPYFLPDRWLLGVYAHNTETGVLITRVMPGSAAAQAGLERNDKIVAVEGFQVGYVNRQLYLLGDELQHRAGANGRVRLLVQNWRNNELLNLDVRLRRDVDYYRPQLRERE